MVVFECGLAVKPPICRAWPPEGFELWDSKRQQFKVGKEGSFGGRPYHEKKKKTNIMAHCFYLLYTYLRS